MNEPHEKRYDLFRLGVNEPPPKNIIPVPQPPKWWQFIERFRWWRWRRRVDKWNKVAFPDVRRVYPELDHREITEIQPMDEPVAKPFYFERETP
jgi:hypothetical protein